MLAPLILYKRQKKRDRIKSTLTTNNTDIDCQSLTEVPIVREMNTFFNSKFVRYGKRNESSKMGMICGQNKIKVLFFLCTKINFFVIMEFSFDFKYIFKSIDKTKFSKIESTKTIYSFKAN